MKTENKNSLLYWFPKVCALGIPVPRTHSMVLCDDAVSALLATLDGSRVPDGFMKPIQEAAAEMGFPLFLRTDLQSGKHGWKKTCYVEDASCLQANIIGVVEENMLGACCFGPLFEALVFREFLDLETNFTAFYGSMPINRERRYFVRDGSILCHHPYWPADAIDGHADDPDWRNKLAVLNEEPDAETALLSDYALTASRSLPGFWSADFAKATDGTWYLIDMALGGESFHWAGCQQAVAA